MVSDQAIATAAALMVTASLPFYLYGAWIMIDTEVVTWDVLVYHLKFIVPGLVLNTIPVVAWMIPRLLDQLQGVVVLHAVLGLQAYALLAFALTGIVRILQVKREADLYEDPTQDIDLDDLHPNMGAWRGRLRVGVFGYVIFWFLAWLLGAYQFVTRYVVG
jgi:hypothetical protein